MTDIERQIASDAAVISIALIAACFVLLSVVWKRFETPFSQLEYENRKELGKSLLIILVPIVFLYAIATFVGATWPGLLQPSGMLAMLLLLAGIFIYFVTSKISGFFRRHQETPPRPKIDGRLFVSTFTLAILGFSVICSTLSLFGVISVALSIDIPNYSRHDFVLFRWLLLDGTALFVSGIIGTAYSIIPKRQPIKNNRRPQQ